MGHPRPFTDDDRRQLRDLHAQGLTRNAIATALHRSGWTISRYAAELGLSFARGPEVAAATEAVRADAKARRATLVLNLLGDAERLRQALWQPCKVYNFGGRDNTYEEREHEAPDFANKLKIMQAVGVALDRSLRLDEYDRSTGADEEKSVLVDLMARLRGAWKTTEADPGT